MSGLQITVDKSDGTLHAGPPMRIDVKDIVIRELR
jgi:hypothetical protein